MEKKSKYLIFFMLIIIFMTIVIGTIIKVYSNHKENLYRVVEQKISETAKSCFIDEICTGNETTLGFLIQNGYIDPQLNPITKEYLSEDLIIQCNNICSVNIRN